MNMNSLGKLQALSAVPMRHVPDTSAAFIDTLKVPTTEERLAELERRVHEQDLELGRLRGEVNAAKSPIIHGRPAETAMAELLKRFPGVMRR